MTKERIVVEERWRFVVFERAGSYFATFLSGGVVDVDRSVRLTESEVAALNNGTSAKALIEQFRANPDAIAERLLNPPVWAKQMSDAAAQQRVADRHENAAPAERRC
jgi:hypothetical protein